MTTKKCCLVELLPSQLQTTTVFLPRSVLFPMESSVYHNLTLPISWYSEPQPESTLRQTVEKNVVLVFKNLSLEPKLVHVLLPSTLHYAFQPVMELAFQT